MRVNKTWILGERGDFCVPDGVSQQVVVQSSFSNDGSSIPNECMVYLWAGKCVNTNIFFPMLPRILWHFQHTSIGVPIFIIRVPQKVIQQKRQKFIRQPEDELHRLWRRCLTHRFPKTSDHLPQFLSRQCEMVRGQGVKPQPCQKQTAPVRNSSNPVIQAFMSRTSISSQPNQTSRTFQDHVHFLPRHSEALENVHERASSRHPPAASNELVEGYVMTSSLCTKARTACSTLHRTQHLLLHSFWASRAYYQNSQIVV